MGMYPVNYENLGVNYGNLILPKAASHRAKLRFSSHGGVEQPSSELLF